MKRQITQCPLCDGRLRTTELSCERCDTRLQGDFPAAPLARLSDDHQRFVETFVRCRGVIRDVERALGISYPTVRARLDAAIGALEEAQNSNNPALPPSGSSADARRELLRQVQAGSLNPAAAAELLRTL